MFSKFKIKFGILITIGIFIITAGISLLINIILTTTIPLNFKVAHDNDWIGYYGSVAGSLISGLVTFLGIYITIKNEKYKEYDNKRMEILPFIKYTLEDIEYRKNEKYKNLDTFHINLDRSSKDTVHKRFYLILKNIGLHAAIKVNLLEQKDEKDFFYLENQIDSIGVNEEAAFILDINIPCYKSSEEIRVAQVKYLNVLIAYTDLLNNYYEQYIRIRLTDPIATDEYLGRIEKVEKFIFYKGKDIEEEKTILSDRSKKSYEEKKKQRYYS